MTKPRFRVKAGSRPEPVVVPFELPACPDVLDKLGTVMEMARDGTIDGVAIAATKRNGGNVTTYSIGNNISQLVGATRFVELRILEAFER